MTDGILLAETQGDPLLSEYNAIIIDEAHERSLNIDFLLGHLKGLLAAAPRSEADHHLGDDRYRGVLAAFDNAPIIEVSGRLYPVEVLYRAARRRLRRARRYRPISTPRCTRGTDALSRPDSGDVLIFMPGERDIRETSDLLEGPLSGEAEIIPLFGRLSSGDQQRVFAPASRRKIVIATNIAETSLTIPGHSLRDRFRPGAHQPLQSAHAHQAAAGRAGFAKQRQPAQRPRGRVQNGRLHPALFGGGFRRAPARSRSRKSSAPISPKSFCG